MKFQKDTHLLDWINANSTVHRWFQKVSDGAKSTDKVYASYLYTYWNAHLSKRLPSIDASVEEVKSPHKSDDLETKRSWGAELQRRNGHSRVSLS